MIRFPVVHFLFFLILAFLFSCSKFTTPLYNDPIYSNGKANVAILGKGGEAYSQRGGDLENKNEFARRPGENFDEYMTRFTNTLLAQEYEIERIDKQIDKKRSSIANLKEQLSALQAKHVELRLSLMRTRGSDPLVSGKGYNLFKQYIVKDGETLQRISYKNYGTYTAWLAIYRFNKDRLPGGPNRIHPGQVLYLPVIKRNESF